MLESLKNLEVVVCAGSGGVGKTTMASTLGTWAALEGKKTLVLTIDPARRLANALGLDSTELDEPSRIQSLKAPGELSACMIESQKVFEKFIRNCSPSEETTEKLLNNELYKQLSTTLSGSQEFTSLEALLQAKQSGKYDLIILDTPPSQHAIDFLRSPEKIFALFQKSITQWFVKGSEEVGIVKKLVNQGTRTALGALQAVTGAKFVDELSGFFEAMAQLQEQVGKRSIEVHRLLSGAGTGFVLVTSLDPAKLAEAKQFQDDLKYAGAKLSHVIVNRAYPAEFNMPQLAAVSEHLKPIAKKLEAHRQAEVQFFQSQGSFLDELGSQLSSETNLICLPEMARDIVGIDGLIELQERLKSASSRGPS